MRWILGWRKGSPATEVSPSRTNATHVMKVDSADDSSPATIRTGDMPVKTLGDAPEKGVEGPSHISTAPTTAVREKQLAERAPDHPKSTQRCEASEATLTGCARRYLAGLSRGEDDIDKYCLLEGDTAMGRPEARGACLFARRGKEYIMLIKNKRCGRELCWRRGIIWEREGEWMLERPYQMQLQFGEQSAGKKYSGSTLMGTQLEPNWGELHEAAAEPGSPSGAKSSSGDAGQGMAVAAAPAPPRDVATDPAEHPQDMGEVQIGPHDDYTAQVKRKGSRTHVDNASNRDEFPEQAMADPPLKKQESEIPGILANDQVAAETK